MPANGYANPQLLVTLAARRAARRADRPGRSARHRFPARRGVRARRPPRRRAPRPLRRQPDRHRPGADAGLPLDHRAPAGHPRRRRRPRPVVVYDECRASAPPARSGSSSSSATRDASCSTAASTPGLRAGLPVSHEFAAPVADRMARLAARGDPGHLARRPPAPRQATAWSSSTRGRRRSTTARWSAPPAAAPFPARSTSNGRATWTPTARFKPAAELRAMYEQAGVTPERDVVTYCQGGYRGAHTYLALRLLGFPQVRNYLGSWREWGDRLDLPIEVPTARTACTPMNPIIDFINANRDRYLAELKTYLAIPSISALPEHAADVRRCAEWTAEELTRIGLTNVRLDETPGHPIVYGEWLGAPGAPTMLFYGHYDVQPVDPLDLWESPPFEATVRDGEIYARGSADDKGQIFMHFKAHRGAPEAGGQAADQRQGAARGRGGSRQRATSTTSSRRNKAALAADVVVISDSPMFDRGIPSICYGLRGLAYFQIDLRGTQSDLHSGSFGGAVANPAFVLAQILAAGEGQERQDQDPRLLRRGARAGAGGARASSPSCRSRRTKYRKDLGAPKLFGESGLHDARARLGPADVRGERPARRLHRRRRQDGDSGRRDGQGEHAAGAGSGSRQRSASLIEAWLQKVAPKTVEVKLTKMHGGKPWMTSFDNKFVQAAARAIEMGFRERAGVQPRRRLDPGGVDVLRSAGTADGALRHRPARRERARAEREARSRTSTTA